MKKRLAIIANDLPPYAYELNPVLGLPSGSYYRARFENKWISADVNLNFKSYEDEPGIFIIRDMENDKLIPVRSFTVVSISKISNFLHIEYCLGNYFQYFDDERSNQELIDEFNYKFRKQNKIGQSEKKGAFHPLILNSEVGFTNTSYKYIDESIYWGRTLGIFKDLAILDNFPFIKIDFVDSDIKINNNTGIMEIKAKSNFTIRITHIILSTDGKDSSDDVSVTRTKSSLNYMEYGPYVVSIKSAAKNILVSPPNRTASGTYDILNFFCSLNYIHASKDVLSIKYTVSDSVSNSFEPAFFIPVEIQSNYYMIGTKILLLLTMFFIYYSVNFTGFLQGDGAKVDSIWSDLSILAMAVTIQSIFLEAKTLMTRVK